jgi:hypothetical protein
MPPTPNPTADYLNSLPLDTPLQPHLAADSLVISLLSDALNRRGWRQEWDGFDDDVKAEIVAKWRAMVGAYVPGEDTP